MVVVVVILFVICGCLEERLCRNKVWSVRQRRGGAADLLHDMHGVRVRFFDVSSPLSLFPPARCVSLPLFLPLCFDAHLILTFRPGWAPTIHIPFATLIRDLDNFCRMESAVPHEPRKRKRQDKSEDKSDEEDEAKDQKMAAKMREMEAKMRGMEAKMREMETKDQKMEAKRAASDRGLRVEGRDAARVRQKLARSEQMLARSEQILARAEQEIAQLRQQLYPGD